METEEKGNGNLIKNVNSYINIFLLIHFTGSQKNILQSEILSQTRLEKSSKCNTFHRYGEELQKLEKITLECIQEVIETIRSTKEKPFNPRNCIHMLIGQIMAILVR